MFSSKAQNERFLSTGRGGHFDWAPKRGRRRASDWAALLVLGGIFWFWFWWWRFQVGLEVEVEMEGGGLQLASQRGATLLLE